MQRARARSSAPAPRRGASAFLLVAAAASVAVAGVGLTSATFADDQAIGGNVFATEACFGADVRSVQTGSATSTANGPVTATISSVDPARAFLLFNTRHASNRPVGSTIRGRIAGATSLEFVRVTDEATPVAINITWNVVEYACGVSVQRGETTQSSTTVNVPIAAVTPSRSFVTWSKSVASVDASWDVNDPVLAEITSTTNLQLRTNSSNTAHVIWWQVVEFTTADASVQKGTTSLLGTALSTSVTLPQAVDPGRTFVLVGFRSAGSGADIGARLLRARLIDSSTIQIDRSVSGTPDDITEIAWQAIELSDGSRVHRGTASFASGVGTATASLAAVDPSRATAFASVQHGGGQSSGRSSYVTDDVPGVASVTTMVTSSQLTLQRSSTAGDADVGWFVVEWGGTAWWDGTYGYRQPVTVSAGSSSVPDAYSAAVTLDHAALVAAGKARADGNDLRIAHWDGTAWTELDRVLDPGSSWDSSSTTVWFRTRAVVASGASDANYFLYYGNATPARPPANPSNVYLFYDGFESGSLSGWTDHGTPGWYGGAWGFRKSITIDRTKVPASQTNFPVLISISDADLRDRAQSDADDVVFTSSNGTTKLDHQIEAYDAATGTLTAWVEVPTVSSTTNTALFLYYGNGSAASQQNPTGIWDSTSAGTYHLNETPTGAAGDIRDSTSSGRHGTSTGGMGAVDQVTGQIGGSLNFDGVNDKVNLGDMNTNAWSQVTAEAWIKPDTLGLDRVICKSTGLTATTQQFCFGPDGSDLRILLGTDGTGGADSGALDVAGVLSSGSWQHIAFTWNGSTDQVIAYVNGAQRATFTLGGATIKDSTQPVYIGNANAADDRHFDGLIDEARVSSTARSASWIQTAYNNQSSPSSFYSVGTQESSATPWSVASDEARSGSNSLKVGPHSGILHWLTVTGLNQSDVHMDAYWRMSNPGSTDLSQAVRTSSARPVNEYETTLQGSSGWNLAKMIGDSWTELVAQPAGQSPPADAWTRIGTTIVGTRMKVYRDGTQLVPGTGWHDVGTQLTSGSVGFRGWWIATGESAWIDDVVVRKAVDVEPVVTRGTEDTL